MAADAILLATGPWSPRPWAKAIRVIDPQRHLYVWPELLDREAVGYALVWKPPAEALRALPNLAAIFSLGAGVDHLMALPQLPVVPVVRAVNHELTRRMSEWSVLQVLMHHRRQPAYWRQQAERVWNELDQPPASAVRVGIMGFGVLGRDAGEVLTRLGFRVAGWSRRPGAIAPGIEIFHGADQLEPFLARTDILVCLLPLTPETHGILSMRVFKSLARDGALGAPILINAGRGGLQVEKDIAAAIEGGILGGASLDVFEEEPLATTSRLWSLPNVVITPHAAAASTAEELVPDMIAQIRAHESGGPFVNVVDRASAY